MADIIKEERMVKLLAAFADEDDRTITINDARSDITGSMIDSLESAAANVLIGDKYGAAFTRFKEAKVVNQITRTFDLT